MVVSDAIQSEIEEKAVQYDVAKEKIKAEIENNFSIAKERLKAVQEDLIDEVEGEFGENPFSEFLGNKDKYTDADAKRLLAEQKIPENFGPDEKSFSALIDEIDSLKEWRIFAPKKLETKDTTWDTITLTWDKVDGASYEVEVDGNKSLEPSKTSTFTKKGLLPETEHNFRVRSVRGSSVSEWSGVVKGRTLKAPVPIPSKIIMKSTTWDSITLTWDKVDGASYQIEVDGSKSLDTTKTSTFTKKGLLPETEHSFRVRSVRGSSASEWSSVVKGRTQKIPIPSNIIAKSTTWDSITLTWDKIDGATYEIEADGSKSLDTTKTNSFTKSGLLPETEHSFRVRTMKGRSVSEWSGVVKRRTLKAPVSVPIPPKITVKSTTCDSITLTWDKIDGATYEIEADGSKSLDTTKTNTFTKSGFLPETEHSFRVRSVKGSSVSEWSGVVKGRTLKKTTAPIPSKTIKKTGFPPMIKQSPIVPPAKVIPPKKSFEWAWKECPGDVDDNKKYSVDERNPRIAIKVSDGDFCTIIGNTHIPPNTITSWSIKVLKSKNNNGSGIYIGIAPSYINQNDDDNYNKRGWYFNCYESKLFSGPPHKYKDKEYGPKKDWGKYVHTGDSVGVVMDTKNGELSFVLNGVNLGVAYAGIPHDNLLVPCVILKHQGDSVELDASEVKDEVNSSVPVPPNITAKNTTWDSITLIWDEVDGASYQIEVDGSKSLESSKTSTFTKKGLLPETEHSFRVRAVRGSSVSEWSGVVKGRTLKAPVPIPSNTTKKTGFPPMIKQSPIVPPAPKKSFECAWKECPGVVGNNRKYSVDGSNPRIASKVIGNDYCTIVGNTHIPLNKATQWSAKILKSKNNNGSCIYIGVAPSYINQNDINYNKCGWYFNCYESILFSGPPHKYSSKEYGPRKDWGKYVRTGDSVGVVVDTTRGELSFVLNGVNLGVAYTGIPLDKPLVPCVILLKQGDSVELDVSEVKENKVDSSVPVPSKITVKSITWDSITLTWDKVDGATYEIEVDGSKPSESSTANAFTKKGLLPETEHSFRVRTMKGRSVSEWSGVVKGRTLKAPVPVPILPKITAKSTTWDSITLTWDKVDGATYEIEVDGSKSLDTTKTNSFTKSGLLPETEHSFRVRTMKGGSVSEWSGVTKGRTLKAPVPVPSNTTKKTGFPPMIKQSPIVPPAPKKSFECAWKECPGVVGNNRKYSVDGSNPRIASKVIGNDYCTIVGNTHIPLNTVTSWNIKILKSKNNNGSGIYIGVAPSDINQNAYDNYNYNKCGWYFDCYDSKLWSGPPHKYSSKEYGPRKGIGQYVRTGNSVGVVLDTTNGELSFVLNGVNLGVAYAGIPLGKHLVPCVLLKYQGDSVELII